MNWIIVPINSQTDVNNEAQIMQQIISVAFRPVKAGKILTLENLLFGNYYNYKKF